MDSQNHTSTSLNSGSINKNETSMKKLKDAQLVGRNLTFKERRSHRNSEITVKPRSSNAGSFNKNQVNMKKLKEARLVVRNLPFKISGDQLKKHFSKCGNVLEVNILQKGKKMVGCGFVQYDNKFSAAKAISKLSGEPLLGRVIVIDWALSKNKYDSKMRKNSQDTRKDGIKEEISEEKDTSEIKKECLLDISDEECVIDDVKVKEEKEDVLPTFKKKRKRSSARIDTKQNDLTIFIKNVPYSSSSDDLKQIFSKFGKIDYALICIDPLTEHSRGTGFVKFKEKASVDACLLAKNDLILNGFLLEPHIALPKEQLDAKIEKQSKRKDNRNLYLAKEGVVLPHTPAATYISNGDMTKRMELENWKTQKLKNLNMFVSRTRLIVQNIPSHITDKELRKILKQHLPNATPCEVKVMRNLHDVDENGIGKSKGYAFVGYNNHEDSLAALRAVNNNPKIFSISNRPIVSFSIENRKIIAMKQSQNLKPGTKSAKSIQLERMPIVKKQNKDNTNNGNVEENKNKYEGLNANFGSKKLFSKYELKKQLQKHTEESKKIKSLKKQQKRSRKIQRAMRVRKESKSLPQKKNKKEFSDLVEKYKTQISNSENKKKWYE